MSRPGRVSLEQLAAQLRELFGEREELMRTAGTVPTPPEAVSAVMDRYDRLLLEAAAMLELDVPADARLRVDPERLTHRGRIRVERDLRAAGLVFGAGA